MMCAAILCARGGYRADYLLDKIDLSKIKAHPKIFIGYSDLTCLLTYFTDAGLATFHGPMAAKDWTHADGESLVMAVSSIAVRGVGCSFEPEVTGLIDGDTEGILYGGCFSMFGLSLGTPYEIKTANTLLFLEGRAAKPYQIDRMLMQLKLGGHLDEVRGIIFGEIDCTRARIGTTRSRSDYRIVGDYECPSRSACDRDTSAQETSHSHSV